MAPSTQVSPFLPLSAKLRADWVTRLRVPKEASDQTIRDFESRARQNSARAQRAVLSFTPTRFHEW
eukprot:8834978-Pyramimonas_sp.AAC.1